MSKKAIFSENAPTPGGAYSHGIIANGFVYTAGFGPIDPVTGEKPGGVKEQTKLTLQNVAAVLAEAGLNLSDVVKATVHLQNLDEDFAEFNDAYLEVMPQPLPVRTTVGSDLNNILVEIDVVAALRQ